MVLRSLCPSVKKWKKVFKILSPGVVVLFKTKSTSGLQPGKTMAAEVISELISFLELRFFQKLAPGISGKIVLFSLDPGVIKWKWCCWVQVLV